MQLEVAYQQRSQLQADANGLALSFSPNLRRDLVSFRGELQNPLLFREAISALHDIVIDDRKIKPKDRSAHQAYLLRLQEREKQIRQLAMQQKVEELRAENIGEMPKDLPKRFRYARERYWKTRQKYSKLLAKNDPELWRVLMPCDPIITVAPDVLFYECFSKDESSYGCLTMDRNQFTYNRDVQLGTTNVDYSWDLFEQFQRLRTYRETRFEIDPSGFGVTTEGMPEYREEKIDLPPSWLQGFMQLQAAMSLPQRKIKLDRESLYNLLGYLKLHRTRVGPRAIRFELTPGKPVQLFLEPWEVQIVSTYPYEGHKHETIRVWGRDRLLSLQRLLPVMDHAQVFLLGTGLPSFWSIQMGSMRLFLGLSGWTANDWTRGGNALADLAPPIEPSEDLLGDIAQTFVATPVQTFEQIRQRTGASPAYVAAGLNRFALLGQLIQDLVGGVYRWRSILPTEIALNQVQVFSPESLAAQELIEDRQVKIQRNEVIAENRLLTGIAETRKVEVVMDKDRRYIQGQCSCSHYFKYKLRAGPCRHMQALVRQAETKKTAHTLDEWYSRLNS